MIDEFDMTDLGMMNFFLGLEVKQCEERISISQEKYVSDLLKRFNLKEGNAVSTPMCSNKKFCMNDGEEKVDAQVYRSLIESLLYLTNSRLVILQAISLLSKFMQSPSKHHLGATKRILRYLKGTSSTGLWYKHSNNFELYGFSYSD